jgi:chitodextrinase
VPTGLKATAISSTQINLTWTASTDNVRVSGYRVYRGTTLIATVTATSYSDSGLTHSTTYSYSVAAFDAAGNTSAKSAAVSATTQASSDTTSPTVPAGLSATAISSSQINLAWTASTDNVGVTGYRVYRDALLIASVTTTTYSDAGLRPSTTYSYSVAAFDGAGNASAQSSAVSATTQAEPLPETPLKLNSPNGGEVLPTGTIYNIAWDGPSSAVTFDLSYSNDGGSTWKSIVSGATGKNHSWQVPVIKRNKKNCLMKVIGYDASRSKIGDDISDASFVVEVTKLTSPNGGQNLKTTSSDAPEKTVVDIAWVTYETKNPVASVKLKYTVNGGRTWKLIDEVSGNPGAYSWELPGAKKLKDKCRVAVILKDADGKTVGVDGSDDYFTMEPES